MKRFVGLVFCVLILVGATGCLEFERQTVYYRHDAAHDTLHIFQDYQGIYGADDALRLTENELEQLSSVMKGERTFFFGNWITEFNREKLVEARQTPPGDLDENPAFEAAIRALAKSALENVKVENVGFYRNGEKQLCGAQHVTIKNVSRVLGDLNKVMTFVARSEAEKDDKTLEEKRLLVRFADRGQKALQLKGNQLQLRWPLPESEFRRFKERTPQGAGFLKSGGVIEHEDGVLVMTLGKEDSKMESWSMPVHDNPYVDNVAAEAKKYGIKDFYDAEREARAYLQKTVSPP